MQVCYPPSPCQPCKLQGQPSCQIQRSGCSQLPVEATLLPVVFAHWHTWDREYPMSSGCCHLTVKTPPYFMLRLHCCSLQVMPENHWKNVLDSCNSVKLMHKGALLFSCQWFMLSMKIALVLNCSSQAIIASSSICHYLVSR